MQQRVGQSLLQTRALVVRAVRRDQIGAEDEKQRKHKCDEGYDHCAYISSKKTRGNCKPQAFKRSANRGRIPVGRKRPITWPCASTPVLSYWKISCMVIVSPSMPVISEIEVTRREPSDKRATWTTRLIAEAICWRIARSDRRMPVI